MGNGNLNELLILIDDIYPGKLSSFRTEEFNRYIEEFNNVLVVNIAKVKIPKEEVDILKQHGKNVSFVQTNFSDKEFEKIEEIIKNYFYKKASIVFLNNIYAFDGKVLKFLEDNKIQFVFTLYPGGGFFLDEESKKKLSIVLKSPMLEKVIVTQKKVYDYILDNHMCVEEKIEYIYGIVTPRNLLNVDTSKRRHFGINNKIHLNICFVAYKYSSQGKDKGYDVFIEVAKKLRKQYDDIYFHVVGNFDEKDIDVTELDERIAFYGPQESNWFFNFYKDKDIILSPTRVGILHKGAFDGFPTGATTEAMLNEVVAIVTDPLNLNMYYENNRELVIINGDDIDDIVAKIIDLKEHPKKMFSIAKNGYCKANMIYSYKKQIIPRIKLLKKGCEKQ